LIPSMLFRRASDKPSQLGCGGVTSGFFTMRLVKLTEGYHLYTLMSVKYHTVHRELQ
jgi:hypothetical protein